MGSFNSPHTWGEFQLSPYTEGAVGGAVGLLAPPKAPLRRVGGVIRGAVGARLSIAEQNIFPQKKRKKLTIALTLLFMFALKRKKEGQEDESPV